MVTLDISSTDIRIMEVTGGAITKWASYSLDPDIFEEGVVTDPQALGTAVKQIMASSGIIAKSITASISSLYSLSRIIIIPIPLEQSITEEAALEAAVEVMPLSEEELYFSWHVIAPGEGGQQVLVMGIPRDILDSEVQALNMIGINPHVLDLKTLALARAVSREQALILNIDTTSFDIIIIANGVAEILRTTAWQPKDLSLDEKAEHLTSALSLTVNFYNLQHSGHHPLDPATPLFITGQLSGDPALVEQLKDGVEYSVEPLAPPLEYPEHMPISQYAVNVGLALKFTTTPRMNFNFFRKRQETLDNSGERGSFIPDINLLPRFYKPWRPSAKQVYPVLAVVAVLGLIFPLYQVTTEAMSKTTALRLRYDAINNLLDLRKTELSNREPLLKTINDYYTIVNKGGGFIEDLETIRSLAGELNIEMTSISHEGSSISFTCQAPDYLVFRDFLDALEESGRFSSVTRPSEVFPYVKGGDITIKLER
ncbi:pilus assembly protein PilM [Chloroflexota bacterium]